MDISIPQTLEEWNAAGSEYLPGHLGFSFVRVEPDEVVAKVEVRKALRSWNGYLHAGTIATLADTCCGYGTVRSLPAGVPASRPSSSRAISSGRHSTASSFAWRGRCTRAARPRCGMQW